jgi:CRP-like cAMP-binding protein
MPNALQYRSGSLIYFQGDGAEKIFILQTGTVNLTYQDIETGQDVHDLVQPGEFFGVKSALGRYPREENAVALQDAAVMAFSVPEFEQFVQANTRIIMKMLKVFSNQLRRIHRQVSNLMEKGEQQNPESGLFNVGAYYLKNRRFFQAKYVLSRYLTYYPGGKFATQAAKYLEIAENSLARSGGAARAAPPVSGARAASPVRVVSPAQDANLTESAKIYYEAVSFITQEKYQQAYIALRKIVEAGEDLEFIAKGNFEIGRCLFLMGKHDDCIQHYTQMLTKYPKHPNLGDALFFMGQSYEKRGRKEQALTFYRKILTVLTDEDEGSYIKAKRALKALEA